MADIPPSDSVKASTTAKESMSEAEANYLWILEYQILPNQYGLKRVALLKAIEVLKSASTTAESEKAASADLVFRIIQRVIAGVNLDVPRSEITRAVIEMLASEPPARQGQAALDELTRIAKEAYAAWDADRDSRVGKILASLAGFTTGYRADIDALRAALAPPPSPAPKG